MSIRPANVDDIEALVELGRAMALESPRFSRMPYNPGKVRALLEHQIKSPRGLVLVSVASGVITGVFVGGAAEHWACDGLVAFDLALFVDRAHRGGTSAARLLSGYKAWCEQIGAVMATAGISTQVHADQSARLYRALGFREIGPVFDVLEG